MKVYHRVNKSPGLVEYITRPSPSRCGAYVQKKNSNFTFSHFCLLGESFHFSLSKRGV